MEALAEPEAHPQLLELCAERVLGETPSPVTHEERSTEKVRHVPAARATEGTVRRPADPHWPIRMRAPGTSPGQVCGERVTCLDRDRHVPRPVLLPGAAVVRLHLHHLARATTVRRDVPDVEGHDFTATQARVESERVDRMLAG